jgi:hypothetical protein
MILHPLGAVAPRNPWIQSESLPPSTEHHLNSEGVLGKLYFMLLIQSAVQIDRR